MENVSYILGQFVAMGELVIRYTSTAEEEQSFYTSSHLESFLGDLDKNLPLYLEFVDEKKKKAKDGKVLELITVMNQLYNLISYQSFRDFSLTQEEFLAGYQSQMSLYDKVESGQ